MHMRLARIDNLRMVDRNKAGGQGVFEIDGQISHAELFFYLQGNQCLSIRLGRHDKNVNTAQLEKYIEEKRSDIRRIITPQVERIREEARLKYITQVEMD